MNLEQLIFKKNNFKLFRKDYIAQTNSTVKDFPSLFELIKILGGTNSSSNFNYQVIKIII